MEKLDLDFLIFLLETDVSDVRAILLTNPFTYDKGKDWVLFYNPEARKDVCLVSHYDTVWDDFSKQVICQGNVLKSSDPEIGIGADDRAGVYACLKLAHEVKWVLFCDGEEMHGIGADSFIESRPKLTEDFNPKFFIELDRKGKNDAVFYHEYSNEFIEWVLSFGWTKARGSFSDISKLTPHYKIPSVNLSIGYEAAHRADETLDTNILLNTIRRTKEMIDAYDNQTFKIQFNTRD
mgnify:CR=1 FL=1